MDNVKEYVYPSYRNEDSIILFLTKAEKDNGWAECNKKIGGGRSVHAYIEKRHEVLLNDSSCS
jgi:hypothetical protein